jgi:hypothetical protein
MIEILPPFEKYKYDTWRILLMKCYIDNSVRLQSCIRNVNTRACLSDVRAIVVVMCVPLVEFLCQTTMGWIPTLEYLLP